MFVWCSSHNKTCDTCDSEMAKDAFTSVENSTPQRRCQRSFWLNGLLSASTKAPLQNPNSKCHHLFSFVQCHDLELKQYSTMHRPVVADDIGTIHFTTHQTKQRGLLCFSLNWLAEFFLRIFETWDPANCNMLAVSWLVYVYIYINTHHHPSKLKNSQKKELSKPICLSSFLRVFVPQT